MPLLKPPSEPTGAYGDGIWRNKHSDLWNFLAPFQKGLAFVKYQGVWELKSAVSEEFADFYLLGGMDHRISDDLAAELTAAGFGQYIFPDEVPVPTDEPGFGDGSFGTGGFGE